MKINLKKNYKKNLLLVISIALLIFSIVGLGFRWRDQQNNEKAVDEARKIAEASQTNREDPEPNLHQEEAIDINHKEEPKILLPFIEELQQRNPDVVGWITVDGTEIDYPVVQAEDNEYYLKRDWLGADNSAGAIFMDYRNDPEGLRERKSHTILYGHHRQDGSMFQNLMNYKDESYFRENQTFEVTDQYGSHTFEIFSAYVTGTDFYFIETRFPQDEDFETFIDSIEERSMFDTDIEVTAEDHILTLSTCTYEYDDARYVVHARRVDE